MKDGDNLDALVANDAVNEPISAMDTFSKIRLLVLGNHSPDHGLVGESIAKPGDTMKEAF